MRLRIQVGGGDVNTRPYVGLWGLGGGEIQMWFRFQRKKAHITATDSALDSPSPAKLVSMKHYVFGIAFEGGDVTSLPSPICVCSLGCVEGEGGSD